VDGLFFVLILGKYTASAYCWRVIGPLTSRHCFAKGQEVHRPVDGHFSSCDIGRCSRQFARDLLTVQAEADVPRAIRFVDVSLLHLLSRRRMCNKMCNTGFFKCNRINVEEWQSG
jgi:hypothetical protein